MIWNINGRIIDLSKRAKVMGILNVTPDSFSDGGRYDRLPPALAHARKMISEGAVIIDIGGESTRPGSVEVDADEETARTLPVIEALRKEWIGLISIDTKKASVAAAALDAGADIINDVSGLTADPKMAAVCAGSRCGIVVMHMRGNPATMQIEPEYQDVVSEIREFFTERLETLAKLGIQSDRICFDPGFGFGKNLDHNLALLGNIDRLAPGGRPVLLGISRKSFLSKLTGLEDHSDRDIPTAVLTALARQKQVMLHRVHNVKANLAALRAAESLPRH